MRRRGRGAISLRPTGRFDLSAGQLWPGEPLEIVGQPPNQQRGMGRGAKIRFARRQTHPAHSCRTCDARGYGAAASTCNAHSSTRAPARVPPSGTGPHEQSPACAIAFHRLCDSVRMHALPLHPTHCCVRHGTAGARGELVQHALLVGLGVQLRPHFEERVEAQQHLRAYALPPASLARE
jgi:hypothetical protein